MTTVFSTHSACDQVAEVAIDVEGSTTPSRSITVRCCGGQLTTHRGLGRLYMTADALLRSFLGCLPACVRVKASSARPSCHAVTVSLVLDRCATLKEHPGE